MTKIPIDPQLEQRLNDAHTKHPMHGFLTSLHAQVQRTPHLSPNQIQALSEILDRLDEDAFRMSSVLPLTSGKYQMRGTIQSTKLVDGKFGQRTKMVVLLDNGNKVYSSVPKDIAHQAQKGLEIKFTGEVTVSQTDEHFGFVKFPVIL